LSQRHTSEDSLPMGLYVCILPKRGAFWMRGIKQQETTRRSKHKSWKRLGWSGSLTLGNCAVGGALDGCQKNSSLVHIWELYFECLPYNVDVQGTPWPVRQEPLDLSRFLLSAPCGEYQWLKGWWEGAGGKQPVSRGVYGAAGWLRSRKWYRFSSDLTLELPTGQDYSGLWAS